MRKDPDQMRELRTSRLCLRPFSRADFDIFVDEMLTDPAVVKYYYSYQNLEDSAARSARAETDFWHHFEASRASGFEVWALYERSEAGCSDTRMIGWAGLIQSELASSHGGPELQYMLASRVHGRGYATEAARSVLGDAEERRLSEKIIAVVDIPNSGSIRVLEKLGFERCGLIEAYGSPDMFLFSKQTEAPASDHWST